MVRTRLNLSYDRITELASKIIGSPVALLSMVGADFQFFKSYTGLPEPWKSARQTPLSHSFCKHVVATQEPLIVSDAREVEFLKDNGAIPDLDVIGYLGVPVTIGEDRRTLGSFCVIDTTPHEWTELEIGIVTELAEIITEEIELKAKSYADEQYAPRLKELHKRINAMLDRVDDQLPQEDLLAQIRQLREEYRI